MMRLRLIGGIGPFVLTDWTRGTEMRLTRNERYRTSLRFCQQQGTRADRRGAGSLHSGSPDADLELEAGSIDLVISIAQFTRRQPSRTTPDVTLTSAEYPSFQGLVFNNMRPPFGDIPLSQRHRFGGGGPRHSGCGVLEGTVIPAIVPFGQHGRLRSSIVAYSEEKQPYSAEQAKQFLADAGFVRQRRRWRGRKDGAPVILEFLVASDDQRQTATSAFQDSGHAPEIGIGVEIAQFDQSFIYDQMTMVVRSGICRLTTGSTRTSCSTPIPSAGRNWPGAETEGRATAERRTQRD
ncbi:MAG: hypothetical protein IPK19_21115 [Chloroflexi bacterium]|nr:hypothetical protein [Chloroflexota bacterium]